MRIKQWLQCAFSNLLLIPVLLQTSMAADIKVSAVNYPPYHNESAKSGESQGISVEIVIEAFKAAGQASSLSYIPMARAEWSLIHKNHQAILGTIHWFLANNNDSLVEAVDLANIRFVFFYRYDKFPNGISYSQLSDLSQYSVASLQGSSTLPMLEGAGLKVLKLTDIESGFQMLEASRIDLLAAVELSGWTIIEKLYPDTAHQFNVTEKAFLSSTASILFLKENQVLIEQFNQGLKQLVSSGKYLEIVAKYHGKHGDISNHIPASITPMLP